MQLLLILLAIGRNIQSLSGLSGLLYLLLLPKTTKETLRGKSAVKKLEPSVGTSLGISLLQLSLSTFKSAN